MICSCTYILCSALVHYYFELIRVHKVLEKSLKVLEF